MKHALPGHADGHVLVLGEMHPEPEHLRWLTEHLRELKAEHNLGSIHLESGPYKEMFLWAYRDGKLPVGTDRAAARNYLQHTFGRMTGYPESCEALVDLCMAAIDEGIAVQCYDSRETLHSMTKRYLTDINTVQKRAKDDPDYDRGLSNLGSSVYQSLDTREQKALAVLHAHYLYNTYPEYKTRLDNVEAVIDAQQSMRKNCQPLGYDATSAQIAVATMAPHKNVIGIIGASHLIGYHDNALRSDATFSEHVRHTLKTTTAFAGTAHGLVHSFLEAVNSESSLYNHPYHVPALLALDTDEVVPAMTAKNDVSSRADADSLAEMASAKRAEYLKNSGNTIKGYILNFGRTTAHGAYPTARMREEIKTSQALLKHEPIAAALHHLRANKPWAELYAQQKNEPSNDDHTR